MAQNFCHFPFTVICIMKEFDICRILRPTAKERLCACLVSYKNIGTLTWGHVWTHTPRHTYCSVLLPPACCWNCFPPSSEPGKAGFIVLTYLCVKSDCGVLYLCLYSDGETERASEWEWWRGERGLVQEPDIEVRAKDAHLVTLAKSSPTYLTWTCNIY